jgi:hypothetical protein
MKKDVFWVVTPCVSCVNRRFGDRIASIFRVEESASDEPALIDSSNLELMVVASDVEMLLSNDRSIQLLPSTPLGYELIKEY